MMGLPVIAITLLCLPDCAHGISKDILPEVKMETTFAELRNPGSSGERSLRRRGYRQDGKQTG